MSLPISSFHLVFPWHGEWPHEEAVVLSDLDIVGVGGKRKKQLLQLAKSKQIIVYTHEQIIPDSVREIYEQELLKTLQWLRPSQTIAVEEFDFLHAQRQLFQRLFPLTSRTLGIASAKLCDEYLQNMDWSSWLLQDHWRYFVGFLRQKFPDQKELIEVAHWEWIQGWLETQPFENDSSWSLSAQNLSLNSSLQTLFLTQENSILQRPEGLYVFYCSAPDWDLQVKILDVYEAALVDLLNEERHFTFEQWVDMSTLTEGWTLSREQWIQKAEGLLRAGIVIGCP